MADQTKRRYDSTVARIAGNLLSGREANVMRDVRQGWKPSEFDRAAAKWAVAMAREIVAEVERAERREVPGE